MTTSGGGKKIGRDRPSILVTYTRLILKSTMFHEDSNLVEDLFFRMCKILETEDLDNDGKPIDYACYTCPESSVGLIGFTKAYEAAKTACS